MPELPEFSALEIKIEGNLGFLWLNRPTRLNALSMDLITEITQAASWFNSQDQICCVIVAGRGRAFSAGADLEGFPKVHDGNLRAAADAGRVMADAVETMQATTIAKIHGWCVGGGLVLAAACDFRLATDDTKFSIPEIDLGIPLAWGGIPRLVREIGPAMTKELVMTCRQFSAQEAKSIGLLNRVLGDSELEQETYELAEQLCSKPRLAIQSTKQHVNAVSAQMGAGINAWSDADGLIVGLLDPQCKEAREQYLKSVAKK